jgi:PAS domain S-box-containing protein
MMAIGGANQRRELRVLLVEDHEYDAELLIAFLTAGGYSVKSECVHTAEALRSSLSHHAWDVVVCDYSLPMFDAPAALAIVREHDPHLPFIIVSGTIGEDTAVRALQSGADDFLIKGNFSRLIPAIERELREVEMHRSMRQMEARAAYALTAAGVGVWEFDLVRGELQWSQDVGTMFGLPPTLSHGGLDVFQRCVHPDDWAMVLDALRDASDRNTPYRFDFRVVFADGTIRWIHTKGRLSRSAEGEPSSMLGIVIDVTERKELEEQLRQSQKLDSIGRLAGGIAHDFNNILTAIVGYTEMTLDQIGPDKPISNDLREIRAAADRAVSLVRQLLAFSRKQTLHPVAVNVNEIVSGVLDMLDRLIGEHVHISTTLAASLPIILADRMQLEQVLMNLVVNARDAMPNGGGITIATSCVTPQDVSVLATVSGSASAYIRLDITDAGIGMSTATQEHIFEPFFTTKGEGKGTGLGLATVYGVVQQLNGHISVSSQEGVGTTFTLYFPQVEESTASMTPLPLRKLGLTLADRRYRVLVVEDQRGVRRLVSRILTRHGYMVLEAEGAAEARALFEVHGRSIDLLITDIVMPDTPGPALAAELCERHPDLRVLFMSGYVGRDLDAQTDTMSHVAALEKPFSPSALLETINHILAEEYPHVH